MSILEFRDKLIANITEAPIPRDIGNEAEFEKCFLMPVLLKVSEQFPGIHIYTHPWNSKNHCKPDCETAPIHKVVTGCPQCWKDSKKWAAVFAFGTNNTFDVAAKDAAGKTLVIEAKLVTVKGGRMPNGDIQRMLGQCSLAKAKHDIVLGVCGYKGNLDSKWNNDTELVKSWFQQVGIELIFRAAD